MASNDHIDDLAATIRKALKTAFERGIEVGGTNMRKKILEAAGGAESPVPKLVTPRAAGSNGLDRAPRGAVGDVLRKILTDEPKLKIVEIESKAPTVNRNVAIKSLGNELRRLEGKKYKRDDQDRWSVIGS